MRSLKLGLLEPGAHGFEMCQEERVDGKAGETLRGHGLRTVLPSTLVTQLRFREREGQAQKEPAQKPHHPGQPRVHGSPTPTHRHTQHQCAHTDTQAHGTNTQSHIPKTDSHTPAHDPSLTQTHTYAQMLTPQRHTTYMAHTIQTHMGSCTYLQTYTEKHTCSPTLEHKWLYPHACSHSHSCTKLAQVSRHTHSCAFNTHTHTPREKSTCMPTPISYKHPHSADHMCRRTHIHPWPFTHTKTLTSSEDPTHPTHQRCPHTHRHTWEPLCSCTPWQMYPDPHTHTNSCRHMYTCMLGHVPYTCAQALKHTGTKPRMHPTCVYTHTICSQIHNHSHLCTHPRVPHPPVQMHPVCLYSQPHLCLCTLLHTPACVHSHTHHSTCVV